MKKNKYALCFFGLPPMKCNKHIEVTEDYSQKCWKNHIIEPNPIDIFIHTWGSHDEESLDKAYNPKDITIEEPIEFENAHQQLGYQVGQLSGCVNDSKLANYLGGIGNKLSTGGQLDAMEYRAVKASLLSAQRPQEKVMRTEMSLAESREYQLFIESFDIEI